MAVPATPAQGHAPAPARPTQREGFRPDVEGLRGIAVLLVVLFHAGVPGFAGGFTGVDVFFVLSGYLITGLLVAEVERTGRLDFVRFYARRVRRLLPASGLMLLVTLAAGAFILSPIELPVLARSAQATALYVSNLWFVRTTTNYFGPGGAENPLLHTWSLAVEEQFYVLWPVAIVVGLRLLRTRARLAALLALLSAVSFALCLWLTGRMQPWAFFSSPARAWEFGIGGLATLIPVALLRARPALRAGLAYGGLAGILAASFLYAEDTPFPGVAALLPVAATACVLAAGAPGPFGLVGRALTSGVLQWLGRLSYSWYLWHWPALVLAAAAFPGLTLTGRVLAAAGSLLVAAVTYRLIENPLRFSPTLSRRPWASISLGVAVPALALVAAGLAMRSASAEAAGPRFRALAMAPDDRSRPFRDGCMSLYADARVRECAYGDTASATTVVLWGDSHADHWAPALEEVARAQRWRLVVILKSACPSVQVPIFNPSLRRIEVECEQWREAAHRRIAALRPTAVVIANSQAYVAGPGREGAFSRLSYSQWSDGTRRTLARLDSLHVPTVLIRDTPRHAASVPTCLARLVHQGRALDGRCTRPPAIALDPSIFAGERRAVSGMTRTRIVDLTDQFCGAASCDAQQDGTVMFTDAHHITATYARQLAPVLAQRLVPLIATGG